MRAIPRTGEKIPALGLGTWQVLDVAGSGAEFDAASAAVRSFLDAGGRVIDSSPMYGRSEERVGDILAAIRPAARPFLATKIWTTGREAGLAQLADSHRLMRAKTLDLVQVHNLQDLATHLATLRAAQQAGTVRYIGVTHYLASAHAELERVIRREQAGFPADQLLARRAGRRRPASAACARARCRGPGQSSAHERIHDRPGRRSRLAAGRGRTRLSSRRTALHQVGSRGPGSNGRIDRHTQPAPCGRKSRGRFRQGA